MTTTLQRLLKHPHAAVFDKAPQAEQAFRLQHANGATWTIADGVMTASDGANEYPFNLSALTVQQLASQLDAHGFDVSPVSATMAGLSAMVLVEGSGDQSLSNGDRIDGFTSLLWALLSSYSGELRDAKTQIGEALRQMRIPQAEGQWLDFWGNLYGFGRTGSESDAAYADRIPVDAFRVRVNAHAIEQAIFDATGFDVRIEEPWQELFVLDQSLLSGPDKFYDGSRAGYHLIQPVSRQSVDWPPVLEVIERNRAAGVAVLAPLVRHFAVTAYGTPQVVSGAVVQHYRHIRYEDRALLDFSTIEEVSIINHASRWRREIMRSSLVEVPSQNWADLGWVAGSWSTKYFVTSQHSRDYRVYFTALNYGDTWSSTRTWATADSTWATYQPSIHSLHTSA